MKDTALVLSGPPGVGKTTVAWRVFDLCTEAGNDPALIDLDLMGAARPAPEDDPHQSRLKATNAAVVWANCRAGGSRRLVVAGVLETDADRQLLAQAVGIPLTVCRLSATEDALTARLRRRGTDHGAGLAKLVRRAGQLRVQLAAHDIADFVVDTMDRPVDEIAADVLGGWVAGPAPAVPPH